MNSSSKLEVHFHDKNKLSIVFKSDALGNDEKLAEMVMFIMLALRQLSNLGNHPATDRLATVLLRTPEGIKGLASGRAKLDFTLIPNDGYQANKRFIGYLDSTDAGPVFRMDAKGFTFLALGVAHYAPMSVVAFLSHLALKRKNDHDFLDVLGKAAYLCGNAHIQGELTVENRGDVGLLVLLTTCQNYVVE